VIVFLLIQEHQNEHGYVDTSIVGVFQHEHAARECEAAERRHAREQGLIVEDDDGPDGEWQLSWRIEGHPLS
jgi:hypothetical protein